MAKKQVTQLIDDLDGTVINDERKPLRFGLDGQQYEIDLTIEHEQELREFLAPYMEHGRRMKATRQRPSSAASTQAKRRELTAIRLWARASGFEVSDRSRIPKHVMESYEAAIGNSSDSAG